MIELVVVILVISFGLLGMTGLFGSAIRSLNSTQDLQAVAQFAQACAEEVLVQHHKNNLASLQDSSLPSLCSGVHPQLLRSLSVGSAYMNNPVKSRCPTNVTCRDVKIEVTSKANPAMQSTIDLMLASY